MDWIYYLMFYIKYMQYIKKKESHNGSWVANYARWDL